MALGFMLYDLMGCKERPDAKNLSHRATMKITLALKDDAFVGRVRHYDTLVNEAQLTMVVLRTAAEFGAIVHPSTQVVGFEKHGERINGCCDSGYQQRR